MQVAPLDGQRFQLKAFLRGLTAFVEYHRYQEAFSQGTRSQEIPPSSTPEREAELTGDNEVSGSPCSASEQSAWANNDASGAEFDADTVSSMPIISLAQPSEGSLNANVDGLAAGSPSSQRPEELAAVPECTLAEEISENGAANASSAPPCRQFWPPLPPDLSPPAPSLPVDASYSPFPYGLLPPLLISLRLERLDLTDADVHAVANWATDAARAGTATVRKLWLFANRIADDGAAAVARMLHPGLLECHLSHNMLTLKGAVHLLEAIPATEDALSSPLWLRLEWNRISLAGLVHALEAQHAQRGLVVDCPEAVRSDAAPPLPTLPDYLLRAKQETESSPAGAAEGAAAGARLAGGGARGARNSLQYIIQKCHCRLPWVSSQFELPSEAGVLVTARRLWSHSDPAPGEGDLPLPDSSAPACEPAPSAGAVKGRGPLLLIPDTSALLAMAGADATVTTPTFFTLELLTSLANQGRFGRKLAPEEHTFLVVPASVAAQLDSLKAHPGARSAVRRFMGSTLEELGAGGANVLTMLGAHEGEGLVLDHGAEIAGSRSADVASRGQAADHRIVEVALFFQQQCLEALAARGRPSQSEDTCTQLDPGEIGGAGSGGLAVAAATALPVILLTKDNGQAQLAKAHGLPTLRMSELAACERDFMAGIHAGRPLTATVLRSLFGTSATTGLGAAGSRSLQVEFDGVVACLHVATDALRQAQQREHAARAVLANNEQSADLKVRLLAEAFDGSGAAESGLLEGLERKLRDWDALVRSHQTASRVVNWAAAGRAGAPTEESNSGTTDA